MLKEQITMVGTIRQNILTFLMKWNLHYPGKYIHPCLLWEKISQWWVTFQKKKESCHFDKFHASRQAIDNNNPKKKPDMILFYNSTKGGVDQMDQKYDITPVNAKPKDGHLYCGWTWWILQQWIVKLCFLSSIQHTTAKEMTNGGYFWRILLKNW